MPGNGLVAEPEKPGGVVVENVLLLLLQDGIIPDLDELTGGGDCFCCPTFSWKPLSCLQVTGQFRTERDGSLSLLSLVKPDIPGPQR